MDLLAKREWEVLMQFLETTYLSNKSTESFQLIKNLNSNQSAIVEEEKNRLNNLLNKFIKNS